MASWGIPGTGTSYTLEIGEKVCELMMAGVPLTTIAKMDGMPSLTTIYRWEDQHEDFARTYNRARLKQADTMDSMVAEIASKCTDPAGDSIRLRALQWRANHLNRRRYGEKQEVAVTGVGGGPVQSVGIVTNDPVEAARAYQRMLSGED